MSLSHLGGDRHVQVDCMPAFSRSGYYPTASGAHSCYHHDGHNHIKLRLPSPTTPNGPPVSNDEIRHANAFQNRPPPKSGRIPVSLDRPQLLQDTGVPYAHNDVDQTDDSDAQRSVGHGSEDDVNDLLDNAKCKTILTEVQALVQPGAVMTFNCVTGREHAFLEEALKNMENSARPTYFRDLQQFIVTIPHDVHEALVSPIISSMDRAFQAMPLSRGPHSILLEVDGNASVDGENITAVPDVCVRISSWRSTPQLAAMREYIFVETAFTQPETQVTHKLKEYITSHPHTLAVMKIMIKESRFSSPSNSSELADRFSGTNVLSNEAWRPEPTHTRPFRVVRDGFTWIDITGVNIEIWMREGETPIDLEVNEPGHPETAYAAGTLLPNTSTIALDSLVDRMTIKFRDIVVSYIEQTLLYASQGSLLGGLSDEEGSAWLKEVQSWESRFPLFNWRDILRRLEARTWQTAHSRYKEWHKRLPKRPLPDSDDDGDPSQRNPTGTANTRSRAKRIHY